MMKWTKSQSAFTLTIPSIEGIFFRFKQTRRDLHRLYSFSTSSSKPVVSVNILSLRVERSLNKGA
jgi:hypothetical protein